MTLQHGEPAHFTTQSYDGQILEKPVLDHPDGMAADRGGCVGDLLLFMINLESDYRECGKKAAEAVNHKDYATAKFHNDWFDRARRLETPPNRILADSAFQAGYSANRNINTQPTYFK